MLTTQRGLCSQLSVGTHTWPWPTYTQRAHQQAIRYAPFQWRPRAQPQSPGQASRPRSAGWPSTSCARAACRDGPCGGLQKRDDQVISSSLLSRHEICTQQKCTTAGCAVQTSLTSSSILGSLADGPERGLSPLLVLPPSVAHDGSKRQKLATP